MSGNIQQHLVVTLVQHDIVWMQPETNRRKLEQTIAGLPQSDIIALPETFTTGFGPGMERLSEKPDGTTLDWMRRMAAQSGALTAGSWIVDDGGRCYNRMHMVYPDGHYIKYDKAHTFRVSGEADIVAKGHERTVAEWKGWRLRPAVCYDLRFPTWLRNEVDTSLTYDLLLVCANWPSSRQEAWNTLLKARAIENICYVAGCNRRGADTGGTSYSGQSAIVDFKGMAISGADSTPYASATLDMEQLVHFRHKWPFHLDFD